jgi:hypothetical protein
VKKLFALILAVLVGTAMVTAPMGCTTEKKADAKKADDTKMPAAGDKKDDTKK